MHSKERVYTVHEAAKLAHTTVKTLHHYHKIGLLIPQQTSDAGYRLYGLKELERLQQILFYKELDFPLKEIKQLLDGHINREEILIKQKELLEHKMQRFKGLIETITSSIQSAQEGADIDMEMMFKGFESEEEWKEVLQEHNEHLKQEYDIDLSTETIDAVSMNESAREAQSFNEDMIRFLKEGIAANDRLVLYRIKEHLSYLGKQGHPSTPQDFMDQTEFFAVDSFHRTMLEQWQTGYTYYLNKAAGYYLAAMKSQE